MPKKLHGGTTVLIGRDFEITALTLKGKARKPVLTLETVNGEKLTIKLNEETDLRHFKTGQIFVMKLHEAQPHPVFQGQADHTPTPNPVSAELCPRGVFPDEYASSEACEGCPNLEELAGVLVCKLNLLKPKEEKQNV